MVCVFGQNKGISWKLVSNSPLNRQVKRKSLRTTSHDQDQEYYFLILGTFQCLFCKYPQLHYFIKWQQKTIEGKTFYRTLSLHMYGGGNMYLDRDMESSGSSDPFPKGTGCTLWFFRMPSSIKLICAFNNSPLKNNN